MMKKETQIIFASRLRQLRLFEGTTQEELSRALNISRSCLANYETCRRAPNEEIISSIAEHFGLRVSYLLGGQAQDAAEETIEVSTLVSKDGQLDISDMPIAGKIALMEFYHYLNDRAKEQAKRKAERLAR